MERGGGNEIESSGSDAESTSSNDLETSEDLNEYDK